MTSRSRNEAGDPLIVSPEARQRRRALDQGFLDRVYKMSFILGAFVAWFLLALGRDRETVSFAIGAALSLAMLWSARYTVMNALEKQRSKRRILAFVLGVTKYGLAGVLIWRLTRWPYASLPFFALGAGLVQIVLLLKALGQVMAPDREPLSLERLRGHWH